MSNTSGTQIANVGFLQRGLLEKFSAFLGVLAKNLVKVVNGEASIAGVDFTEKSGSDKLANETMEEVSRRLVVTFENRTMGNIVYQTTAPEDRSKVWVQIDPVTGIPLGYAKVYNSNTATWVPVVPSQAAYVPPQRRYTTLYAAAGQSQATAHFETMNTSNYSVLITPTTFINGSWVPAPATFPTHFGCEVVNKAEAELTINFFGTPTGGATFEIDLTERV